MKTVTFYSAQDASIVDDPRNVISIGSPGDERVFACEHKRLHVVDFDDVEGFVGSDGLHPFTLEQAREILAFVDQCGDEPILVHCQAGMSRSAAVALFLAREKGYLLDVKPPCIGHTQYHNRHVYDTLHGAAGGSLAAYYAELELADRMRG